MWNLFVPTIDQAILTDGLAESLERMTRIQAALTADGEVSDADWLEIYDILDRVKDNSHAVLRPAPRTLVDAYIRTRTWLREIHPRLRQNRLDAYARRQLATLITRLAKELHQHCQP